MKQSGIMQVNELSF